MRCAYLKIILVGIVLALFVLIHVPTYAEPTSESKSEENISVNPRDDYRFGVGTMVGGPFGVMGLIADMNWDSLINAEAGVGSGIYYDSYSLHGRYLILDNALTPYVGAGLAYWDSITNGLKIAQNSDSAVKLGLVKSDGTGLKSGIVILPLSLGLHYLSENGLSLFADFEFMVSTTNLSAVPYGALAFQWYF